MGNVKDESRKNTILYTDKRCKLDSWDGKNIHSVPRTDKVFNDIKVRCKVARSVCKVLTVDI